MNNDFRKYATKHLGINGLLLDEVMSTQAQYLNPYILEERQLNVTQMDVFSRLMMDRIISSAHRLTIIQPIRYRLSCCTWTLLIRVRTSAST